MCIRDSVTAVAGSVACAQAGQASYADSVEVTAGASGTVTGLSLRQGDAVEQGELLFTLENSSLLVSSQSSAPVSYTHLDVYKRQASAMARTAPA